jgi:hypothetical protein
MTLLLTLVVGSLLLVRRLPVAGWLPKVAASTLTALLMVPLWDKVERLAATFDFASASEHPFAGLIENSASFDQVVTLRTEEVLRRDDRSEFSALPLLTTAETLNYRSGPGVQARTVSTLPLGTRIVKRGRRVGGWIPVKYREHLGWVSSAFVALESSDSIDEFLWKDRPFLTIRQASMFARPGSNAKKLFTLPENAKLVRGERSGMWVKVQSGERAGWTSANLIRIAAPAEASDNLGLAVRLFFQDAFPQVDLRSRVAEYVVQVVFWVAFAFMRRPGRSLLESLAGGRIPALFAANTVLPALWFGVNNRHQLLVMSENEKSVIAAVAVAFTTLTWLLVDAIVSRTVPVLTAPGKPPYKTTRLEMFPRHSQVPWFGLRP